MESVQDLFNFIIGCFDANEIIKNYISTAECESLKPIDLLKVLDFISNLRTTPESSNNLSHIKVERGEWNVNDIVEDTTVNQELLHEEKLFVDSDENIEDNMSR